MGSGPPCLVAQFICQNRVAPFLPPLRGRYVANWMPRTPGVKGIRLSEGVVVKLYLQFAEKNWKLSNLEDHGHLWAVDLFSHAALARTSEGKRNAWKFQGFFFQMPLYRVSKKICPGIMMIFELCFNVF